MKKPPQYIRRLALPVLLGLILCAPGIQPLAAQTTTPATNPAITPSKPTAEINALIEKTGAQLPDWWDSVKLEYPPTLDLKWPAQYPSPGDPKKQVTLYYIHEINPNPARHREGLKLMYHLLEVNKDDPSVQARGVAMLGRIYAIYLQDYARGAYWYRKAAKSTGLTDRDWADLAYCYWKLGSHDMALAQLETKTPKGQRTVRVLGSIGEVAKALELAQKLSTSGPEESCLLAGDVCRENGRFAEALDWYQKVLTLKNKNAAQAKRFANRANEAILSVKGLEKLDLQRIPDGTYSGESMGYRGNVKVNLVLKAGRIVAVNIEKNTEDWPLNALIVTPAKILEKQSIQNVDMVSGATYTSKAIINASGKALSNAGQKP